MSKKKIINAIKKYNHFLISTHVNPDPDAICSELAVAEYIRSLGKKVTIVNESDLIKRFEMFPGAKKIKSLKRVKKINYDLAIILDCGDLNRIGKVQQLLEDDKPIINIDHHITNDKFGNINLIDVQSSSTAELLYELLTAGKCVMTKSMATNLYCGMMTDTGSFRYENTSSRSHLVASELLKFKIKVSELYNQIYETIPLDDLAAFTQIINKFETFSAGQIVCLELRKRLVDKFSDDFDLRDAIFKFLRSIAGVEVIFILTEFTSKKTRVNFRSSSYVDVAKISSYFDGGGHKRASGCVVAEGMKDAKKLVLKEIKKEL